MKKICKQCGKEFEITQSEIDFFKSKSLDIPKRCKDCRNANKKGKMDQSVKKINTGNQLNSVNKNSNREVSNFNNNILNNHNNGKGFKILLICIVIMLIIGAFLGSKMLGQNSDIFVDVDNEVEEYAMTTNSSTDSEIPVNGEVEDNQTEIDNLETTDKESDITEPDELTGLDVLLDEDSKETTNESTVDEKVLVTEEPKVTEAPQITEEPKVTEVPQITEEAKITEAPKANVEYHFRNEKLLNDHYTKHGVEMGFDSAESYAIAAAAVVNNPYALHKTEAEDGDDVYYVESTNEFVIVSTDGYIRTYFNPSGGIDYFNRQ